MKKTVLTILIFAGAVAPFSIFAQKTTKKKQTRTTEIPVANLKTPGDTLAYAMGANMVQGLPQYLSMLGVLADTAAISAEYTPKIQSETDPAKKTSYEREYKTKMDSANAVSDKNFPIFLDGFKQSVKETDKEKIIFNNGVAIADQIKSMVKRFTAESTEDINMDLFLAGFLASMQHQNLLIENPQQVMESSMRRMQEDKERKAAEELKTQYADKIAKETAFFEENKSKPGIVTRPSGLQYKVVKEGNGVIPEVNDKVKVHYHGTLLDGTVFDSSVDRGEPIEFNVGQLIRGWNEALLLMPQGSKWTLYIPYDLGYGDKDMGVIKPFSGLIFEVELLEVEKSNHE